METALKRALSGPNKMAAMHFLNTHPESFDGAIRLALSGDLPCAWRAAWVVGGLIEENDRRIRGHIKDIIDAIPTKGDGHQRELLKILLRMELDEDQEGILFDHCLSIWESTKKQPSVRSLALQTIVRIVQNYPDLSREVTFLTRDHYLQSLSPGIKSSVLKMIEELTASGSQREK